MVSVVAFAVSNRRLWAWLAIIFLCSWVVTFGWTAHVEYNARLKTEARAVSDDDEAKRKKLRELLEAAIIRGDHAGRDVKSRREWVYTQYEEFGASMYELLNGALGPQIAHDFGDAYMPPPQESPGDFQDELLQAVQFLRDLLKMLDSLPIMGDWQP